MKIQTTRFGEIEIPDEHVYLFPAGLLGFPDSIRYGVLDNPGGGPFQWMQSADEPRLAFVICDPRTFLEDYKVAITAEDLSEIDLEDMEAGVVMVILNVPPNDPKKMTANLLGPLVFNPAASKAKQIVLMQGDFSTRHPVFGEDAEGEGA